VPGASGTRCAYARHFQAHTNLAIEEGVLPCSRLQQRFPRLGMGHGPRVPRPRGPLGVRPPEGLRPGTPGPRRRTGQVVSIDIFETFSGGKHGWHGNTPMRRLLRMKVGRPLAEQSGYRLWCGVEGRTGLSKSHHHLSGLYGIA
jgi:hypothetical protein